MTGPEMASGAPPDSSALLASCRRRTGEAWQEITAVAEALSGTRRNGSLNDRQRAQLGNMLRRLVDETEAALHQALAAALEARPELHGEAVAAFADRVSLSSYDRLVQAGVLFEVPLVEAALHRMFEHRLESALRPSVADSWQSGAGPESGDQLVSGLLGDVQDRRLVDSLSSYVVERTRRSDGYGEPILRVDELGAGVVERLHWHVAGLLCADAAAKLGDASGRLDNVMQQVVYDELDAIAARATGASSTAQAVAAIEAAGALNGALVVEALRHAEVPLFLALGARLTQLRPELLRRLIFEGDGFALAILARAVGLSEEQFETIFALTRHARTPARALSAGDTARLTRFYDRIDPQAAQRVWSHWRLDPRYLDAIWRLEGTGETDRAAGVT